MSASGHSLINLHNFTCRRGETTLFQPVSLQAGPGDCIELQGPNGVGKSTLLRTLAGVHQQYAGEFAVETFVYQGHRLGLDGLLSALENLTWYAGLMGATVNPQQLREVLDRVNMVEHALMPIGQMSQGQQRRVAMAKWLLAPAPVWLLDEPMTALDPHGQAMLTSMLAEHCAGGGAALCATHVSLGVARTRRLDLSP